MWVVYGYSVIVMAMVLLWKGEVKCWDCSYSELVEASTVSECVSKVEQLAGAHTHLFNHLEVNQYVCFDQQM